MEATDVETAWAEVQARWQDEGAHRAFLDGLRDLDGLAEAGSRYRAALEAAPGDAVAGRWRDEVVRRATALALAQLPRARPPRAPSPALRRALLLLLAAVLIGGIAWVFRAAPPPGTP